MQSWWWKYQVSGYHSWLDGKLWNYLGANFDAKWTKCYSEKLRKSFNELTILRFKSLPSWMHCLYGLLSVLNECKLLCFSSRFQWNRNGADEKVERFAGKFFRSNEFFPIWLQFRRPIGIRVWSTIRKNVDKANWR